VSLNLGPTKSFFPDSEGPAEAGAGQAVCQGPREPKAQSPAVRQLPV
jgi:hypothetical protein